MSGTLLKFGYSAYLIAALFICIAQANAKNKSIWSNAADIFLLVGFVLHCATIALRWQAAGRPPFASMYEALVLFAWAVVVVYFVFDRIYRARILFAPALILVLCMLTIAFFGDSAMKPLVPALQSKWISIHVVTYFIGYGALSIAFMLGLLYVAHSRRNAADSDYMRYIDTLIYRLIIFGFPFLTIGMTTGSAWADVAWGTYWGWDPKETCSLITWLVYAVYLHMRILRGWKDSKAAWLNIIGFLVTLFTFVGVNFILPGLHSYS
jgi:cytochrome c-type biogenesis protein CcsB